MHKDPSDQPAIRRRVALPGSPPRIGAPVRPSTRTAPVQKRARGKKSGVLGALCLAFGLAAGAGVVGYSFVGATSGKSVPSVEDPHFGGDFSVVHKDLIDQVFSRTRARAVAGSEVFETDLKELRGQMRQSWAIDALESASRPFFDTTAEKWSSVQKLEALMTYYHSWLDFESDLDRRFKPEWISCASAFERAQAQPGQKCAAAGNVRALFESSRHDLQTLWSSRMRYGSESQKPPRFAK